jgi:sugar lactone lactonase YvrE
MSNVRSLDTFNLKLTGHATTPALYDMDAAEYASKSFSVAGQDTQSYGMAFKPDGLSIFIIGQVTDAVYQYTLATAWDVSTASYASKSFSVAGQETSPQGVTFKPDGLSMFIVGFNSDTVYQYTLSTAWDVSTASYASKSFSVAGQETSPREIVFKPDGTAMLIVGTTNDTVYQYTLSTAWDVSTASYASKSFSVAGQETTPLGMAFSVDGTAMLIVGTTNDTVYQYTLSTAWDVSTASYASKSFSVAGQDTQPVSLGFKTDGTVMFILGTTNNTVYQYTCDGSVYATVTYPAAFDFPNGDVPTAPLDDVVNSIDFVTTDGGTTWLGTQIGEDYK